LQSHEANTKQSLLSGQKETLFRKDVGLWANIVRTHK